MKKHFKLGIIGCGAMAQTILKGVVLSDFLHEKKIIVSEFALLDRQRRNRHRYVRLQ